jgi:hypothetical protein
MLMAEKKRRKYKPCIAAELRTLKKYSRKKLPVEKIELVTKYGKHHK